MKVSDQLVICVSAPCEPMVNVGGALEEDLEGPPVTNELKDS